MYKKGVLVSQTLTDLSSIEEEIHSCGTKQILLCAYMNSQLCKTMLMRASIDTCNRLTKIFNLWCEFCLLKFGFLVHISLICTLVTAWFRDALAFIPCQFMHTLSGPCCYYSGVLGGRLTGEVRHAQTSGTTKCVQNWYEVLCCASLSFLPGCQRDVSTRAISALDRIVFGMQVHYKLGYVWYM